MSGRIQLGKLHSTPDERGAGKGKGSVWLRIKELRRSQEGHKSVWDQKRFGCRCLKRSRKNGTRAEGQEKIAKRAAGNDEASNVLTQ